MTEQAPDCEKIDLTLLVRRVIRGLVWVLVLTAVVAGATWAVAKSRPKTFEAQARIEIGSTTIIGVYNSSLVGVRAPDPDPRSMPALVEGRDVIGRAMDTDDLRAHRDDPALTFDCKLVDTGYLVLSVRGQDRKLVEAAAHAWLAAAVERMAREYGVSDGTMDRLRESMTTALAQWQSLYERLKSESTGDFAEAKLRADADAARNLYISLAQAVQQAQLKRDSAQDAVSVLTDAHLLPAPVSPQPKRDAIIAGLLAFSVGLFVVLFIGLIRLDR